MKMRKAEFVEQFGEEAWTEKMARKNEKNAAWMKKWRADHPEEARARDILWRKNNPEKVRAHDSEISRRGGRYYEAARKRGASGIPNEKRRIRTKHNIRWRDYKKRIAPLSELHHIWLNNGTADYSGVALVEADQHRHGLIDVIEILEGKVNIFTERELREGVEER